MKYLIIITSYILCLFIISLLFIQSSFLLWWLISIISIIIGISLWSFCINKVGLNLKTSSFNLSENKFLKILIFQFGKIFHWNRPKKDLLIIISDEKHFSFSCRNLENEIFSVNTSKLIMDNHINITTEEKSTYFSIQISFKHCFSLDLQELSCLKIEDIYSEIYQNILSIKNFSHVGIIFYCNASILLHRDAILLSKYKYMIEKIDHFCQYHLNCSVPLFFHFTHCSQIDSFYSFASLLSPDQLNSPFGFTLKDYSPNINELTQQIDDRFQTWIQSLENSCYNYQSNLQENSIYESLHFIKQLFFFKFIIPELLIENINLINQGFFWSTLGEGELSYDYFDSFFESAHLSDLTEKPSHTLEIPVYFHKQLIPEIFIPKIKISKRQKTNFVYHHKSIPYLKINTMSAFFLLNFLLISSFILNNTFINNLDNQYEYFLESIAEKPNNSYILTRGIPLFYQVYQAQPFYQSYPNKMLLTLLFFAPLYTDHQTKRLWENFLSTFYWPELFKLIHDQIINETSSKNVYHLFKFYLALYSRISITTDELKQQAAQLNLFNIDLNNSIYSSGLDPFLKATLPSLNYQNALDPIIINLVKMKLQHVSPFQFIYEDFIESQSYRNNLVIDQYASDIDLIFNRSGTTYEIPWIYTLDGRNFFNSADFQIFVKNTDLVFSFLELNQLNRSEDFQKIKPLLWQQYRNDYYSEWNSISHGLYIKPFLSISGALTQLNLLTQPNNALIQLTQLFQQQTDWLNHTSDHSKLYFSKFLFSSKSSSNAFIDPQVSQALKNLQQYFSLLTQNAQPAQKEFIDASLIFQNKAPTHPIVVLNQIASSQTGPLQVWLQQIVKYSLAILLEGAQQTIEKAWQDEVFPSYQTTIAAYFPFNLNTDIDVNLVNFANFFGYNGILDHFIQEYLLPFYETSSSNWQPILMNGVHLPISDHFINKIKQAQNLQSLFFPNHDKTILIQFTIQPYFLDPNYSQVNLSLGKQILSYQHGPQESYSWSWPILNEPLEARLQVQDFDGNNFSLSDSSPWQWFRLWMQAKISVSSDEPYLVMSYHLAGHDIKFKLWFSSHSPIDPIKLTQLNFSKSTT